MLDVERYGACPASHAEAVEVLRAADGGLWVGAEMDDDRWRRVREKIAIILGKERSPSATT